MFSHRHIYPPLLGHTLIASREAYLIVLTEIVFEEEEEEEEEEEKKKSFFS